MNAHVTPDELLQEIRTTVQHKALSEDEVEKKLSEIWEMLSDYYTSFTF